jgi:hypothetical protein
MIIAPQCDGLLTAAASLRIRLAAQSALFYRTFKDMRDGYPIIHVTAAFDFD